MIADGWKEVNAALLSGDWARAKPLLAQLLNDGGPASPERSAIAALVEGGAMDRLAASSLEARSAWYAAQIIVAAENKDKATASARAFDLVRLLKQSGASIDEDLALKTLKRLCNVRAFEALACLGDRMIALGLDAPAAHKLTAQGLIDHGNPRAGIAAISGMLATAAKDHPERLDGLGVAGRAYKQVYVDASAQEKTAKTPALRAALLNSIKSYEEAYLVWRTIPDAKFSEWSYPAINLVAVLGRAKRDGITPHVRVNADDLTKQIIQGFEATPVETRDEWAFATVAEAYIAAKDWASAELWLKQYADRPNVTAFQLAGTIRQLEEVWKLTADDPAEGRILCMLKARLLEKEGGQIVLTPEARAQMINVAARGGAQPEVYLSEGRPKSLTWFKTGLERANSVGLIKLTETDQGFGSGFLVRGGDFIAHLGDEAVLLTNAHVISELASELNDPHVKAVHPKLAQVEFTQAADVLRSRAFKFNRILWQSPRSNLDACLLALESPPTDIPWLTLSDQKPVAKKSRVIVIGHPGGERELKVSLYESPLTDFSDRGLLADAAEASRMFLRYNNPTIPGNSGSPVFDIEDWRVIGLHHAGSTAQAAGRAGAPSEPHGNEGVYIRSIAESALRGDRTVVAVNGVVPAPVAEAAAVRRAGAVLESVQMSAAKTVKTAKLAHKIPQTMVERHTEVVSVGITRLISEKLIAGLRPVDVTLHDVVPYAAMTVTLRAPTGGFNIVPLTAETQWLDRAGGSLDDVTTWKWSIEPLRPGRHTLELNVQGREFRDGIEAALPPDAQSIVVSVDVDRNARALTFAKWAAVASGGGALSWVAQVVLRSLT